MGTSEFVAVSLGRAGRALSWEMTLAAVFGSRSWALTRATSDLEGGFDLFELGSEGKLWAPMMTERAMAAESFARFSDEAAEPTMNTDSAPPDLGFFSEVLETGIAWVLRGGGTVRVFFFFFESERRKAKEGKEKRRGSLPDAFAAGEE